MNRYCINLSNVPDPLIVPVPVDKLHLYGATMIHKKIPDTLINPNLVDFLFKKGLKIGLAESFYLPAYDSLRIHEDGGDQTDALKINWVYGGEGSTMNWYEPIADPIWYKTGLGVPFKGYTKDQVKLVYSCSVGCPSLLQVGPPHNVVNADRPRFCVSLVISNIEQGEMASFNESIDLFKEHFC